VNGIHKESIDMEHRCSHRVEATLCAELRITGMPAVTATTRNICRDGLFLRFAHPQLRHNQILELTLYVPDGGVRWHTWAIVVHASQWGAGVLLAEGLAPRLYQAAASARQDPEHRQNRIAGAIRSQGGVKC
jgi:hypothetical protein